MRSFSRGKLLTRDTIRGGMLLEPDANKVDGNTEKLASIICFDDFFLLEKVQCLAHFFWIIRATEILKRFFQVNQRKDFALPIVRFSGQQDDEETPFP